MSQFRKSLLLASLAIGLWLELRFFAHIKLERMVSPRHSRLISENVTEL